MLGWIQNKNPFCSVQVCDIFYWCLDIKKIPDSPCVNDAFKSDYAPTLYRTGRSMRSVVPALQKIAKLTITLLQKPVIGLRSTFNFTTNFHTVPSRLFLLKNVWAVVLSSLIYKARNLEVDQTIFLYFPIYFSNCKTKNCMLQNVRDLTGRFN